MTITEQLVTEHGADLLREAAAYNRVASRAARKPREATQHRSFLATIRRQPACAIGCEA